MTPIYLDSQEAVDRHNERVKVQREAFAEGIRESVFMTPEAIRDRAEKKYPFAQLRPSGFVGGSGARWEYREGILRRNDHEGVRRWTSLDPRDRAAASAALCSPEVWWEANRMVAQRPGCGSAAVAVGQYEPEIIAEAQALLDREGNK